MKHNEIKQEILYKIGSPLDYPIVYVIKGKNGDLLIDTAHVGSSSAITKWIKRNNFNIKWILFTHGHFDHTDNAKTFKALYGAKIIMHKKDYNLYLGIDKRPIYPSSKKYSLLARHCNKILSKHKKKICSIDYLIDDNDSDFLRKLGFDADIIMLPGHTDGSIGILQDDILYAGDACSAVKGVYYTQMIGINIEKLLESNKKILGINPRIICPGHGRLIKNFRNQKKNVE